MKQWEGIIEAVLFAMGVPVPVSNLAAALDLEEAKVQEILESLRTRYEREESGLCLLEFDDSVQLATKPEAYDVLKRLVHLPQKHEFSDSILETLSIIAYKQPVTRADIAAIRGVNSDYAVNRLLEYGLIEEQGRLTAPGRPILFGTTLAFLQSFGLSSLEDLPALNAEDLARPEEKPEEMEQLSFDFGNETNSL